MKEATTLVLGATGATGRLVVQQLLDKDLHVHVIVRSKERMLETLKLSPKTDNLLQVTEQASLVDISDADLEQQVAQVDTIVSCLGHNLTFQGIFGHPRRLVTDATKRLTAAMKDNQRFILMSSNGVGHEKDDERAFGDRCILFLLRYLVPPHADNEDAAAHLQSTTKNIPWVAVRPTDLVDAPAASQYKIYDKPIGSLFGSGVVSRANVAKFMVDLITDKVLFAKYEHQMPVLYDAKQPSSSTDKEKTS